MARRTGRPLSEHYGDLVRVALMEARPSGLQTVQLVAATRLRTSQVKRGIRHLRDVGAAENLTPIIWRRKDGYLFSDDPADWIEYDNGAKWRALPADYPPWETVYGFFARWNRAGVITYIRDQLRSRLRTGLGRCAYPVTLIVDSQSVKGASTVSRATRGFDPAKLINGRKRHIAVDTKGLPVMIMVTPADMQDRDAARELLWRLRLTHPQITQVWADSAYAGQLVTWAADFLHITLKTVSRPKGAKGFVVLPRRWRVERTLCATRRFVCIPGSAGRNSEGGSWAG